MPAGSEKKTYTRCKMNSVHVISGTDQLFQLSDRDAMNIVLRERNPPGSEHPLNWGKMKSLSPLTFLD